MGYDAKSARKTLRQLQAAKKAIEAREQTWMRMTAKGARHLSDETLLDCLFFRLDKDEDALKVPGARRTLLTVQLFDMEVLDGGLCQYFDNCPESVPYLEDALAALGAEPYLTLLRDTLAKLEITPERLGTAETAELLQCGQQCEEHCPFAAFDDAYCDLCNEVRLEAFGVRYARAHLQELF